MQRVSKMKSRRAIAQRVGFIALCLILSGTALRADDSQPGTIKFRGHMAAGFSDGEFKKWTVTSAKIDEAAPENSVVEVEVDVASLDTGIAKRDRHLRTEDFFDVEKFPTAKVRLSGAKMNGDAEFVANITLDLHGKTKEFPMTFKIVDRAARKISGEVTLKRNDFDIGAVQGWYNPFRVDDDVLVIVDVVVPTAKP